MLSKEKLTIFNNIKIATMAFFLLPLSSVLAHAQGVGLPGGPSVNNAVTVVFFNSAGDADGYTKGIWLYGTNGYFTSAIPAGKALVITDAYASINRNTTTTAQSIRVELRAGNPPLPATPPSSTTGRLTAWEVHFDAGQGSAIGSQSWHTGLVFTADRLPYIVSSPTGVSAGVYTTVRAQGYLVDLPTALRATPTFAPTPVLPEEK